MMRRYTPAGHSNRGMSLIEILVGLVIGMLGVLVIFQTMAVWGARTATTMSGGDARTNGAIAMYYLERDLRQGGLGFGMTNSAGRQFQPGCSITVGANTFLLSAADITDGASGASDSVTVLYANSTKLNASATTNLLINTSSKTNASSTNANLDFADVALFELEKNSATNFYTYQGPAQAKGEWVVLANAANCELTAISSGTQTLNKITFDPVPTTVTSGNLMNLGTYPQRATWSIVAGNRLVRTENDFNNGLGTVSSDIADGVVNLQAQYGLADGTWKSSTPTSAEWAQVRAVKVAILVRSKQYEKPENGAVVTPNAPVWRDGTGAAVSFVMKNVDGSSSTPATCPCSVDVNDWRQYRYEVFERVVPLRNLIWGAQS